MKENIMETALKLFNEQGYVEVGMRQIARELSISPGNLTYHFKKKEDLLFALLEQFSTGNSGYYQAYIAGDADVEVFLKMMEEILNTQYRFRGVYIGNQVVQSALRANEQFDYLALAERRMETFRQIFNELKEVGHLKVTEADISFLVSFMALFGRFWISEATLFNRSPDRSETIRYYLDLLARELLLFATPTGRSKIEAFLENRGRENDGPVAP